MVLTVTGSHRICVCFRCIYRKQTKEKRPESSIGTRWYLLKKYVLLAIATINVPQLQNNSLVCMKCLHSLELDKHDIGFNNDEKLAEIIVSNGAFHKWMETKKSSVQFTMTFINSNFPNVDHSFQNAKLMMFLRLLPSALERESKFLERRELFQLLCVTLILYLFEPPFFKTTRNISPRSQGGLNPKKAQVVRAVCQYKDFPDRKLNRRWVWADCAFCCYIVCLVRHFSGVVCLSIYSSSYKCVSNRAIPYVLVSYTWWSTFYFSSPWVYRFTVS